MDSYETSVVSKLPNLYSVGRSFSSPEEHDYYFVSQVRKIQDEKIIRCSSLTSELSKSIYLSVMSYISQVMGEHWIVPLLDFRHLIFSVVFYFLIVATYVQQNNSHFSAGVLVFPFTKAENLLHMPLVQWPMPKASSAVVEQPWIRWLWKQPCQSCEEALLKAFLLLTQEDLS